MTDEYKDEALRELDDAACGMMKILRNVAAQFAADWFGPDSGVIVIVSHDHPDQEDAGRVRVSTNMGNDVASRLMFELAQQYARDHGLDLSGPRVYVVPGADDIDEPDEARRARNATQ